MAHPHHEHRAHHKEKSRVGHILRGYAHGGAVHHSDEREDEALIKREVKSSALKHGKPHKAAGGAVVQRQDKVQRARGGRTKHGKGHTAVNVIVAPQGGHPGGPPMPPAGLAMPPGGPPPGPPAGGPPPMPPRPPMMPPGGAPPMGGGMPPPGLGPRRDGGRATYAKGGRIKSGGAWEEGLRNGTHVSNNPSGKNDLHNLGRGKPITYKTGGAIEASKKMGPKFKGGSGGGAARMEKGRRANRDYVKA